MHEISIPLFVAVIGTQSLDLLDVKVASLSIQTPAGYLNIPMTRQRSSGVTNLKAALYPETG